MNLIEMMTITPPASRIEQGDPGDGANGDVPSSIPTANGQSMSKNSKAAAATAPWAVELKGRAVHTIVGVM